MVVQDADEDTEMMIKIMAMTTKMLVLCADDGTSTCKDCGERGMMMLMVMKMVLLLLVVIMMTTTTTTVVMVLMV